MITSTEYKNEYDPFLYNAMLILDNYASKRTSQIFVLLVNVQEQQLHCQGSHFIYPIKFPDFSLIS